MGVMGRGEALRKAALGKKEEVEYINRVGTSLSPEPS